MHVPDQPTIEGTQDESEEDGEDHDPISGEDRMRGHIINHICGKSDDRSHRQVVVPSQENHGLPNGGDGQEGCTVENAADVVELDESIDENRAQYEENQQNQNRPCRLRIGFDAMDE